MNKIVSSLLLLAFFSCQNAMEDAFVPVETGSVNAAINTDGIDQSMVTLSAKDAKKVADLFFAFGKTKSAGPPTKEIKCINDKDGEPAYYIINRENNAGFILISATKNYAPVLGYAESGNLGEEGEWSQTGVSDLLDEYLADIEPINSFEIDSLRRKYAIHWAAYEHQPEAAFLTKAAYNRDEEVRKWQAKGYECFNLSAIRNFLPAAEAELFIQDICSHAVDGMNSTVLLIKRSENQYGPLLATQWGQGVPFNVNAPNGWAGCGPIAMAQVMRYHQWPTTYNWSAIGNNPASDNAEAKRMILDVRKAADVSYDSNGTGTTSDKMKRAFERNFNYTAQVTNYYGYSERLKAANEIKWNRPVIMSGFSATPQGDDIGHGWVAEGYKENIVSYAASYVSVEPGASGYEYYTGTTKVNSEYFYMNWGLSSGKWDGWFYSDMVNMNSDSNYNKKREMITVKPNR